MGSEPLRDNLVLVHHTEGYLLLLAEGIQLVAGFGAVEVNFVGLFVENIAQGHGIGITFIPRHGQHPEGAAEQDVFRIPFGKLLFFAAHFSEHGNQ